MSCGHLLLDAACTFQHHCCCWCLHTSDIEWEECSTSCISNRHGSPSLQNCCRPRASQHSHGLMHSPQPDLPWCLGQLEGHCPLQLPLPCPPCSSLRAPPKVLWSHCKQSKPGKRRSGNSRNRLRDTGLSKSACSGSSSCSSNSSSRRLNNAGPVPQASCVGLHYSCVYILLPSHQSTTDSRLSV